MIVYVITSLFISITIVANVWPTMAYTTHQTGTLHQSDYRIYFRDDNGLAISPWHDIPMFADKPNRTYNMVVEIPRWTNAKMEINKKHAYNPIKHDVKNNALRYVRNIFPYKGYIWNYGAIPQTWEHPTNVDHNTGCVGDNDPIDIIEIGSRVANRGDVIKVKILGVLALIDERESDWKLISIDIEDPLAEQLDSIEDVDNVMPGLMKATLEWFKMYKVPDGKPANEFAFNGEIKDRLFAENIIADTHRFWLQLFSDSTGSSVNELGFSLIKSNVDSDEQNDAHLTIIENSDTLIGDSFISQVVVDHEWYYITVA